jgi:hypothetical protein
VLQELRVPSWREHDSGDDEDDEAGADEGGSEGDELEIRTEAVFYHLEEVGVCLGAHVGVEEGDFDATHRLLYQRNRAICA